jgi:hypothetical protein
MTNSFSRSHIRRSLLMYLQELKQLTCCDISVDNLLPVEESEKLRVQASRSLPPEKLAFTIKFIDKTSQQFRSFVKSLADFNPGSVYVWLEKSSIHGLCEIDSLGSLDLSFPFDLDENGIIVIRSKNLKDRLLLNFYYDDNNEEMLEIEIQGENWIQVSLPIRLE